MESLERISIEPTIRFGKPCVRGTRITVGEVLGYLAGGATMGLSQQTVASRARPPTKEPTRWNI
jgi:uncharacterized protein (DUF433 family)